MSDSKIRRAIRSHYEGKHLPAERMAALVREAESRPAKSPSRRLAWIALGAAAAIAVALWIVAQGPEQASVDAMARKIVLGHSKDLAAEFHAEDYVNLNAQMPKLDFTVTRPDVDALRAFRFVGARYCSLNQRIAVLLKMEAGGRRFTIYQVADDPVFDEADGQTVRRDGLLIRFWRKDGVFMAGAGPAD